MNVLYSLSRWLAPLRSALVGAHAPFVAALALAVVLGWQISGIAWRLLPAAATEAAAPAEPPTATAAEGAADEDTAANRLAELQLFGEAVGSDDDDDIATVADTPQDAPETQLDLDLRGLYAVGDGDGFAIIDAGSDGEQVFAVGDNLPGGAEVAGIHADRVLLRRQGELEALWLGEAEDSRGRGSTEQEAPAAAEDAAGTARELRAQLTQEPGALTRMIRFQPHREGGELVGFRLQPRGEYGETLRELGLTPEDVLTEVNGIPLDDPRRGREALDELRDAATIRVELLRGGEREQISLDLGGPG